MSLRTNFLNTLLLAPLVLTIPVTSLAEEHEHEHEHRQHDAHVHGIAGLNLALEGDEVHIELDSPAANIVGFEHAPSSEADHAALDKAVVILKDGNRLFKFNDAAGCKMEKAHIESGLLEEEHAEHADKDGGEHAHEAKHEHEEHEDEHEGHADIEAAYHFECDAPGNIQQLSVELFEAFPATDKLKVQYIIESRQGAVELTPTSHVVKF